MDPFEGTPLRETWNERTSEFTQFKLVIRLSRVKPLAFSFIFHCRPLVVELLAAVPGFNFPFAAESRRNLLFPVMLKRLTAAHDGTRQ